MIIKDKGTNTDRFTHVNNMWHGSFNKEHVKTYENTKLISTYQYFL
jgi:hypothetical protein